MKKKLFRAVAWMGLGVLLVVLLFPFRSSECSTEYDALSKRLIDRCTDKLQPAIFYLLGW